MVSFRWFPAFRVRQLRGERQNKPVGFRALLDYISYGSQVVNIQVVDQAELLLHIC